MLTHLGTLILDVLPIVFAITLHEAAHGYAALAMGDDTARRLGRLSLNPLRHVDRVGTLLIPGLLLVTQALTFGRVVFMFGWAKPVPISAWRFRHPRQQMAIVAAAGPAMNFSLAFLTALVMHLTDRVQGPAGVALEDVMDLFILSNLVLGMFNLIPIPPLDGGRIAVGVLPAPVARIWARLESGGILIVLLGVILLPRLLGQFGIQFDPLGRGLRTVLPWAYDLVMHAAGWT